MDSRHYWEQLIQTTCQPDHNLEVHAKNQEFKCRSYPKYNVKPKCLKDEFFSTRSTFFQDNRFIRWHHYHSGANLYSCGGTSSHSTKETISGYNAMIDKIKNKLNATLVDITLADTHGQMCSFFDAIRATKTTKEMDKQFNTAFNRSAIPYVVCSALNKAFNIVTKMSNGKSVIVSETSESNAPIFTSIVTSLVQIIIDERYRHIDGFVDLIDREWMLLGHDFTDLYGWIVFIEAVNHMFKELDFFFNQNILPLILHAPTLGLFEQFSFKNQRHRTQQVQQHGTLAMANFNYFIKKLVILLVMGTIVGQDQLRRWCD